MTTTSLDRTVRKAFTALCRNVGTPTALEALSALEREDWLMLVSMKIEIADYDCPRALSGDLQIASFFKKYEDFNLGFDLKEKAVSGFLDCERSNYRTNEFLSPLTFDFNHYGESLGVLIRRIREQIRSVLGRVPLIEELDPRFGPGSTFHDVGPYITVPDKMSDAYTMTASARPFLRAWDQTAWSRYAAADLTACLSPSEMDICLEDPEYTTHYAPRLEVVVRGNRFTTVPKDAKRHRGICIEPSINLFYQLGVGTWLTKRMGRKLGWEKDSRQTYHRFLAQLGSFTRSNATIDLSNASDTVCTNLVKLLLPEDWFILLDSLRSRFTLVDGKWHKLEKFSSMGNGFTFELETLIFDSIARSVSVLSDCDWHGGVVSVFGDDIICPRESAGDVIAALKFFGFTINEDKSFVDGSFRESCGGDFFKGLNVRPHHLKKDPSEPHQLIALANGLRRFGIRHILCGGPDVYRFPWICILSSLPKQIAACRGPEHLGDQVVHDSEEHWRTTERSSIRYFRVWRPVTVVRRGWHHFRPGVVLASALYGVGDGRPPRCPDTGRHVLDAGGVLSRVNGSFVSGYRFGRTPYS